MRLSFVDKLNSTTFTPLRADANGNISVCRILLNTKKQNENASFL